MSSSAVRTFADPGDYAATIRAATVRFTVMRRGAFSAKLTRIDLHRLWMQRFSDNLPRVADAASLLGGRAYFTFLRRPGPSLFQGGLEISSSALLRHGRLGEYFQRSPGAASFGTMSLPLDELAAIGEALGSRRDLAPPQDTISVAPRPGAFGRLRRLHAAAGRLAEEAPEVIANPDAARRLEQALVEALVDCLAQGREEKGSLAQGQHAIVMRRFRRMVEENPEQPLYVPEICKTIGVSERSLRSCCQEHLGMSPKRYLVLRRLHQVQRALRAAAPEAATVTEFAMRYGFWQLGRFAVEYRAQFGEAPSATLRRPQEQLPERFAGIA
jgi:AraC-like DNA-binding protein